MAKHLYSHSYHDEETLHGFYDFALLKRLLKLLFKYKHYVICSLMLLGGISLLLLAGPYLTKIAIDVYIKNADVSGLSRIAMIYILVLIVSFFLHYMQIFLMQLTGQKIMLDLRTKVFSHVQNLPMSFFDANPIGRILTRVTEDIQTLNELFASGFITIAEDILTVLGTGVAMLLIDWQLALVTFAILPILYYIVFLFRRKLRSHYREIRAMVAKLNAFLQESVAGIQIIKVFRKEEKNKEIFSNINSDYLKAALSSLLYYSAFFPLVEILSSISFGLLLWYGGGRVIQEAITIGVLVAFLEYAQRFFKPVRDLSEKYNLLQSAMASAERVFKLLDTPGEKDETRILSLPQSKYFIEFKDVWFSYDDENFIFQGLSLAIHEGEHLAIVGITGAGKTTLANLLLRFYEPQKGEILINGINIQYIPRDTLRKKMSFVAQDIFIFDDSIRENISMGEEHVPEEKIIETSQHVNLHVFVKQFPLKYEQPAGEGGSFLSMGQRQLLSLARALAFNREILILDEATSSIDSVTEKLIQQATQTVMEGRTAIIIAHRLSTIKSADRIAVLHKGKIREIGTHAELLSYDSIYAKLYKLQYDVAPDKSFNTLRKARNGEIPSDEKVSFPIS